jgi:hypothetical protein
MGKNEKEAKEKEKGREKGRGKGCRSIEKD